MPRPLAVAALLATAALAGAGTLPWPSDGASLEQAVADLERLEGPERDAAGGRLEETLARARTQGDPASEARLLVALGALAVGADNARAFERYGQAVAIARPSQDHATLRAALNRLGTLLDTLGRRQEAVARYEEALALVPAEDVSMRAQILNNLGSSLSSIGEKARAIETLGRAVELRGPGVLPDVQGQTLLQLGRVYASLGEPDRALELYREALVVVRAGGQRKREADALNNIGTALAYRDDLDGALAAYAEALPLYRELRDAHGQGAALNNAGWAHDRKGDFARAVESFQRSVALFRTAGARANEAQALTNLGRAYVAQGDPAAALAHLESALAMRREVKDPRGEAQTLYYLARAKRAQGRLPEARADVELALARAEGVRAAAPGPRLRASFQATVQDYYGLLVDVLLRQDAAAASPALVAEALGISERARARSLLDLLVESGLDIRGDADPNLLERERALRTRLSALADQRTPADARAQAVQVATEELERVESQLRAASPRYDLVHARPAGLEEIRDLLDDDTVLLEYALGEERSHLWTVTRDRLEVHPLPPRSRIETAARELHERLRRPESAREAARAAAALGTQILAPAVARLDRKRLVIVADGALEYVPFAVLPDPASSEPLVARHEIARVPSASALAILRRERGSRPRPPRDVVVLADPVFAPEDSRLAHAAGGTAKADPTDPLPPAVRSAGFADGRLPRLPGTRREAGAIMALLPPGRGRQALDFEASRAFATSPELGEYRVVHFATHGLLDAARPELSGIVFSLVDREGRPQNGFLRLHELYGLKLPADLVVLSACRTALGREVRGEGLVGLTRGFMYAGASRVMASLWTVDDRATAELMTHFYRGLLGPEALPPAAALRAAQDAVRSQKRWSHPYYWAGFVLHGDWK